MVYRQRNESGKCLKKGLAEIHLWKVNVRSISGSLTTLETTK